ncbi:MAG: ORF6N domain-containing protein, partial [Bacteroidales bacterium]|nr:ORF6N domain-containing protein [Bacteroidales bacterium]
MTYEIIIKETDNIEIIKERILEIRGQRVMLDKDLAELY